MLHDLHFRGYEDPLPSSDIDGYAELCRELRVQVIVGEFVFSPYDFPEYLRRGAADTLRFVVDNIGGITPGVKVGVLAECHGMECMPHGVGNVLHQAAHLQCELAMPNSAFIEVPYPQGCRDAQPYIKDPIRIAADGCVLRRRSRGWDTSSTAPASKKRLLELSAESAFSARGSQRPIVAFSALGVPTRKRL